MSAKIIDGKKIAGDLIVKITKNVEEVKKKYNITPTLAVILVGNDPASEIYVSKKESAAHLVGMNSIQYKFANEITEEELINKIKDLNNDQNIHGILVQLPLPKHIDAKKVIHTINHKKDVDGFNVVNVGKLSIGELQGENKAMIPCTPLACIHLLKSTLKNDLSGLKALVIGTSNIVGRPLARLLMAERCTVTVANSKTRDLKAECLAADIVISAAGVPNLIKVGMVTRDQTIIDVGINRVQIDGKDRLVGDVDFENVREVVKNITPVPGGVGPMTIAYLLQNTLDLCVKSVLIKKD